ncbi:MAG: hypothetical protein ACFFFT_17445 [Candidatus Thorarchaeota archaeon]
MESREVIELLLKEIKKNSYINISEFLKKNKLKNLKIKDIIEEIERNYNKELILDVKNKEIYSYNLVYNYFKLKLFKFLEKGNDIDLSSNDFKAFKPDDLIRIFSIIDSEFLNYLLENI